MTADSRPAGPLDPQAANRRMWDARARIHAADRTGFYEVEAFLAGRSDRLDGIAEEELGPVAGLEVAHLQCHFGLDSLRLAKRGARVTGLDFSPVAIAEARALAARAGLPASFVEADVTRAAEALGAARFDLAFVSWGALNWLPDLRPWAREVAALLRPGGRLFLKEGHPTACLLEHVDGRLAATYRWRTPPDAPDRFQPEATYTDDPEPLPEDGDFEWIHPLSAVIGALLAAGMRIEGLEEHETLVWDMWPGFCVRGADGLWRIPPGGPSIPLSYTLRAAKP